MKGVKNTFYSNHMPLKTRTCRKKCEFILRNPSSFLKNDFPFDHFLLADGLPHSGSDVSELLSRHGRAAEDSVVKVARDSRLARIDALRNFLVRHYMWEGTWGGAQEFEGVGW